MQIGSSGTTTSRTKAKTSAKTKRAKADANPGTLHLKAKQVTSKAALAPTRDVASMIATAAYFRAVQRGFEPGHELDDWLQAERQVRLQVALAS